MNASTTTPIENSLNKVREYIERSDYKGFDPYDGLMSPVFSIPVLNSNHKIRFLAQQFIKRSPVNLRQILGIRKGVNPVTVGLCLQAYTALAADGDETARKKCPVMVDMLEKMIAEGFSGPCWGYDFHWEARYARIPAFKPTVVATGIITNALYKYALVSGDTKARDMVVQSAAFIINDLNRTTDQNGAICFSYSPFDRQVVFNASLKGARLLVQADALSSNSGYTEIAKQAARFVSERQTPEGSWSYAEKKGNWTDNYHTGYVLDCLEEVGRLAGTDEFLPGIRKGLSYYLNTFFEDGRIPRFYDKSIWPVDCTAAAQSILTLVRFGETATAIRVAEYMAGEMQASDGHFFFRKYRNHTVRTPFMRWSDAWMFAALAELEGQIRKV